MTITNALVSSVEHFSSTPRVIRLAFLLLNLAYPLFLIGFSTNGWVYIAQAGQSSSDRQGLWNYCSASGVFTCCQSLNSYLEDNNRPIPEWIDATRTLLCFGLVSSTVAMVTMYLCAMIPAVRLRHIIVVERLCYVSSFVSGGLVLIGIAVFGAKTGSESWQTGGEFQGSFGVAAASGILFLLTGLATSVPNKRNKIAVALEQHNQRREGAQAEQPGPSAPPLDTDEDQADDDGSCCVCLDAPINAAFVSCGHTSCCLRCANDLMTTTKMCPICRQPIERVIQIYRS